MEQQEPLQLKDIHLPGSPDFWPPAMGWWLLLAIVVLTLFWMYSLLKKRNRVRRRRRELLKTLGGLEDKLRKDANNETLAEVNTLLRQLAVNYYPRSEIASLTGGDWLHFLDRSGNTRGFSRDAGRVLIDAPYQSGKVQNFNIDEFIPLVRHWVKKMAQSGGGVI